jgi:ribonucleoside-diphosphate reductase alpha chain
MFINKNRKGFLMITKVKKRDGRIVDFDKTKIAEAIFKAAKAVGGRDRKLAESLADKVVAQLEKIFIDKIPSVEDIQDIVEKVLIEEGHARTAKAYILYRQERRLIREEKKRILEKEEIDEVDKNFDVNALRILAGRYLLKDEKGKLIEGPKQMFERVAIHVGIVDLLHDERIFSKEKVMNEREIEEELKDLDELMNRFDQLELAIGNYRLNQWHVEGLLRCYGRLLKEGKMKVGIKKLIEMIKAGQFDKYQNNIKAYYELMVSKDFLPNSPTLMNAGARLGQLSACFVLPIEDDLRGIMKTCTDIALISKSGGGVGVNYSCIRPKNDVVASTSGVASGPLSFMEIVNTIVDVIKQGGKRRGANMAVLEVWHPDIEEFITIKQKPKKLENFNLSVGVWQDFIDALNNDADYALINPRIKQKVKEIPAKKVLDLIAFSAWKSAEPGILFFDNINKYNVLANVKGMIKSTNPCVTGETLIITNKGLIPASKLKENNPDISVITASGWNKVEKIFNNGLQQVYRIKLANGIEIKATEDHKFYSQDGWKSVKELKPKDKLMIFLKDFEINGKFENLFSIDDEKFAEVLGLFVGDGSLSNTNHVSWHIGNDKELCDYIYSILKSEGAFRFRREKQYVVDVHRKDFAERFRKMFGKKVSRSNQKEVPEAILKSNSKIMAAFLRGLFSADGSVYDARGTPTIALSSTSKKLLQQVQQMLIALGIYSTLTDEKGGGEKIIKGKKYSTRKTYRVLISGFYAHKFAKKIGFIAKKQKQLMKLLRNKRFYKKDKEFVEIVEKKKLGKEVVYDITAKPSYTWVTNGIYSLDCGEQPLYEYESCNLGSINLKNFVVEADNGEKFFDWQRYEQVIRLATRFLDNIIDINKYPIEEIEKTTRETRKIGLGVMGLSDCLFELEIAYNSKEGFEFMNRAAETLSYVSMDESCEIAKTRGSFPLFEKSDYTKLKLPVAGYYEIPKSKHHYDWEALAKKIKEHGIRNAFTTTIAPTGSISMIAGCGNGIEPAFSLVYEKHVTLGKFYYIDPVLEKKLKAMQLYNEALIEKICKNNGCLFGLSEFDEKMQKVFVTALSMHWLDHIIAQAIWQKWVSASISKTINMPNDTSVEDIKMAYLIAHELGLKGLTVFRDGSRESQVYYIATNETLSKIKSSPSTFALGFLNSIKNEAIKKVVFSYFQNLGFNIAALKNTDLNKYIEKSAEAEVESERKTEEKKNEKTEKIESKTRENFVTNIAAQKPSIIDSIQHNHINIIDNDEDDIDNGRCPLCNNLLVNEAGCNKCINCGWSACVIS